MKKRETQRMEDTGSDLPSEITQAETNTELLKRFQLHLSSKLNEQAKAYQRDIQSILESKLEALELQDPSARQNPKLRELIHKYASQLERHSVSTTNGDKLYPQDISDAVMAIHGVRIHGYRFCQMLNNAALNPFIYIRKWSDVASLNLTTQCLYIYIKRSTQGESNNS
jgi:hypothetical protein